MPGTETQYDLAVIGGGPAGTAAAITAARAGARVALFETRDLPRHKVCGEFVSGEALQLLAGLLKDLPQATSAFANVPMIERTRLFFGRRVIEVAVSPTALSITRYDLDAMLWNAAQRAGVDVHSNCEVKACDGDRSFTLQTTSGNYTARTVVVAAGRWSQFTADRTLPPGPKWIGVKAHFREINPATSTDLYFFGAGYCGLQPIAHDVVNACAMVRSDHATSLEQVFGLHAKLTERAAAWQPVTQPVSTSPLVYRRPQPVRDSVLFVGDAAAFIDPFAGDGISIALRSGQMAAKCLCEFWQGGNSLEEAATAYEREYAEQFTPLILAASRVRALFSLPAISKPVVFELLRFPGLIPYMIRKTRRSSV
jgi:flavin-dependent dehydrogenase